MGHSRIGTLPRTRWWDEVVDLIAGDANVRQVADTTLWAAQKALATVVNDVGFREAMYLAVQLALAGREKDAAEHMAGVGVELGNRFSAVDVASALSAALDHQMAGRGNREDWGEMARETLVSAACDYLSSSGQSLFEATRSDLTANLSRLHREKEFGEFGKKFFGMLANKCLNYFLSKTLGTHVGAGRRFATMNELKHFKEAMTTHCHEAAEIVQKFSGQWLQKKLRENGGKVTREDAEKFGWNAIRKMRIEIARRARRNGK